MFARIKTTIIYRYISNSEIYYECGLKEDPFLFASIYGKFHHYIMGYYAKMVYCKCKTSDTIYRMHVSHVH